MTDVILALSEVASFEGFVRTVELFVMIYMLRVLFVILKQTKDLHVWHNVDAVGEPGRKIWWGDPRVLVCLQSIEGYMKKLSNRN